MVTSGRKCAAAEETFGWIGSGRKLAKARWGSDACGMFRQSRWGQDGYGRMGIEKVRQDEAVEEFNG